MQRSLDGGLWQDLGRVKGAGNSYARRDYAFTDFACPDELCYFRLKQCDTDRSIHYSFIRSLLPAEHPESSFTVMQDPDHNCLHVSAKAVIVSLSLVNMEGVRQEEMHPAPGTLSLSLPLHTKSKGLYVLNMVDANSAVFSKKILLR